jgi:hypothetical protein
MSEETKTEAERTLATPAEAQNTEQQPAENMIPQSRFDEINKRMKAAEAELAKQRKATEDAKTAELAEKQEYEKLYQTETQKAASLAKQLADLQAAAQLDRIRTAVESEARKAGFTEPADAYLFLSLDAVEMDDAGKPKGVEKLVKDLAQNKPYLVAQRTATPGNGAGPRPAGVGKVADEAAAAAALRKVTQLF